MIVFAHFGHWYVSALIYLGPIALIALWVKFGERTEAWRERRRAARRERRGAEGGSRRN